jgi:sigma-E factor negative regulatory protein RseA
MMKQNISILMDGELCSDEAEILLGRLKRHPEARSDWLTYHLIGDALRQPDYVPVDISGAIFTRLREEPTVLAPPSKQHSKAGYFAMSAVASIMAVAFLAWWSLQIDAEPLHQQVKLSSNAAAVVSLPVNEGVNDYLLAHQEYSPGSDVRGASSYIRTVAYTNTVARK